MFNLVQTSCRLKVSYVTVLYSESKNEFNGNYYEKMQRNPAQTI